MSSMLCYRWGLIMVMSGGHHHTDKSQQFLLQPRPVILWQEQETELAGDGAVAGLAADGESSSLGQGTLGADGGAQQDANRHPDSAQRSGDQSSEFDVSQVDSDSADSTEEYLDEDDSNEGDILEANVVDEEAEAAEEADVQDAGSEAAIEAAEAAHQGAFRIAHDEL